MNVLNTTPNTSEHYQEPIDKKKYNETGETENSKIYSDFLSSIKDVETKENYIIFIDSIIDLNQKNKIIKISKNISLKHLDDYFIKYFDEDEIEDNINLFIEKYGIQNNNENQKLEDSDILNDKEILIQEALKDLKYNIQNNLENINDINKRIKRISQYKNLIVNLGEIKNDTLLKESQDLLEKLDGLTEKIITKEKAEKEKEKAEKEKEKAEKEKEKAEKEKEKVLEGLNALASHKDEILKAIDGDKELQVIIDIFNNLENGKLTEKQGKVLSKFLLKKDADGNESNLELFFSKLEKTPELKKIVVEALSSISTDLKLKLQNPVALLSNIVESKTDKTEENKVLFIGTGDKDIHKTGDILFSGDKYIDFGKKPPVSYIKAENGFRLKTKFTLPDTMDIRADYQGKSGIITLKPDCSNNSQTTNQLGLLPPRQCSITIVSVFSGFIKSS